jgi:hypothetical protein
MRAFLTCLALLVATSAHAQQQCGPRDEVISMLAERFGEELRSVGLSPRGIVEIYSSEETGTWTILMNRTDGLACLLASGQLWEQDAVSLEPEGDPT